MKFTLCWLLLFNLSSQLYAQLCLKSVQLNLSKDQEQINNLGGDLLLNILQNPESIEHISNEDWSLERMNCENPSIRIGLVFEKPGDARWQYVFGLQWINARIDAVTYQSRLNADELKRLTATTHQIGGVFAVNRSFHIGRFVAYLGGGQSIGITYRGNLQEMNMVKLNERSETWNFGTSMAGFSQFLDPDLSIIQHSEIQIHPIQRSIDISLFAQSGLAVRLARRLELGLEARYGYAHRRYMRQGMGGPLRSVGIQMKYHLQTCHSN